MRHSWRFHWPSDFSCYSPDGACKWLSWEAAAANLEINGCGTDVSDNTQFLYITAMFEVNSFSTGAILEDSGVTHTGLCTLSLYGDGTAASYVDMYQRWSLNDLMQL
jgi:hypothetical protein